MTGGGPKQKAREIDRQAELTRRSNQLAERPGEYGPSRKESAKNDSKRNHRTRLSA